MSSKIYHERQSLFRCAIHTVNALLQQPKHSPKTFDEMAKKLGLSSIIGNYDINVLEAILMKEGLELQWWGKKKEKTAKKEENEKKEEKKEGSEERIEKGEGDERGRMEEFGGNKGFEGGGKKEGKEKEVGLEEEKEKFKKEGGREEGEGRKWREKGVIGMIFNDRGKRGDFCRFLSPNHWFALKEIDGIYWNLDSRLTKPARLTDEDVKNMVESTLYNEGFVFLIKEIEFL